ncbi:MAG TPA: hypothetical protein VHO69_01145, partial [Phototrophicaceae bacterium]|nr:hypothetical protein [Phototrophicaceae bacterium]
EAFNRARQFLKTQARPLDQAMFEFRFEGGTADEVLAALQPFQNEDGGFGHALASDRRAPSSSALETTRGLKILREVGCTAEHPMVQQAIAYLQATFDPTTKVWRPVAPDTNDYPHAPWWHDEDGSLARTFTNFLIMPRIELVALLYSYRALVPAEWLDDLAETMVNDLEKLNKLDVGMGDETVSCLDFVETAGVPEAIRQKLLKRIRETVPGLVSCDPAAWGDYVPTPLKLAPLPTSPTADLVGEAVQVHLDYLIDQQAADGAWEPNWSWFGSYPEVWEQARAEWRGYLTVDALTTLRAHGRLEV